MKQRTNGKRGPQPDKRRSRRIVELYEAGRAPMDIARMLACSPPHVYGVLHREKVWRAQPMRRPLTGAETLIRRLHHAGLSQSLLAHLLGVSPVAVYKALQRRQQPPKARSLRH